MKMRKFSVVIPVKNREGLIGFCIESVLSQSLIDFEIIVVDDASIDGTIRVVQEFRDSRISLISLEEPVGRSKARNIAIANSNSEYIAILDSDDIMYPNRLQVQSNFLDLNPNFVLVGGILSGHPVLTQDHSSVIQNDARSCLVKQNIFDHSSISIRSNVFKEMPKIYREKIYEDYFLYSDLIRFGQFGYIEEELGEYRYHDSQVSKSLPEKSHLELQKIRRRIFWKCLRHRVSPLSRDACSMSLKELFVLFMPNTVYKLIEMIQNDTI